MTTPDPPTNSDPSPESPAHPDRAADSGDRIAPLRGAGVQINGRQVARVLLGIVVASLAVLVVVFTVTGIHNNHQINELQNQGIPVAVTVTSCQGLLGGSGSNGAGYTCRGTYEIGGHRHNETLPGTSLHGPGAVLRGVAVPSDPGLVSLVSVVADEHASMSVFILPAVLLAVLAVVLVLVGLRRRSTRALGRTPAE